MQPDDYGHWLEAGLAALVALGAWVWRVGRKYQMHEDRLHRLEENAAEDRRKRERDMQKIFDRLDELGRSYAAQSAKLDHIAETCAETRRIALDNCIPRRPGSRRAYDPEVEE